MREQIIFPEIDLDKIDKVRGLTVSIVTTAKTDAEGKALLQALGMPFRALGGLDRGEDLFARSRPQRPPKFKVRGYNRCPLCGRPRAFYRRFQHVPPLPARPGAQGPDPRPDQGELVRSAVMSMTDPIADLLTRIRNGAQARKE